MNQRLLLFFCRTIAVAILTTSSFVFAKNQDYQPLSQSFFIQRLKAVHPFFKQQKVSKLLFKNKETLTTTSNDWLANISTNRQSDLTNINTSLTKTRYQSGETLSAKHAHKSDNNTSNNSFSLNYTKPLWRNKDGINSRLPLELAKFDTQSNQLLLYHSAQAFLQTQLLLLVDLSLLQQQITIHKKRLQLANKELNLIRQKFSASLVEKIDVLSQKDTILRIKTQLLLVQQNLAALKSTLSVILSLPSETIKADFDLYQQQTIKTIADTAFLSRNHYQLKILETQKQKLQRQLKSNKNQKNPDLSLNLGVIKPQNDNRQAEDTKLTIGLSLSFPIHNSKQQTEQETLLLSLQNIQENYQITLQNVSAQASALLAQLAKSKAILNNNRAHITLAKERAVEESKRYQNGLTQINFVISAQNNEQNTRLSYANNAADYQKLYLNYQALLNQIQ